MNKKEIAEIRRRLTPDKNAIGNIYGCYVNTRGEVIAEFSRPLISLPQEEGEKYLSIFKRTLSGQPGKNLLDLTFRPDQVMDGEEHRLLMALRDTELKAEDALEAFYQRVIDALRMESNYLILLAHDAYDVPYRARDEFKADDVSEEVFGYILCGVCPVKPTKPALRYCAWKTSFTTASPTGSWARRSWALCSRPSTTAPPTSTARSTTPGTPLRSMRTLWTPSSPRTAP